MVRQVRLPLEVALAVGGPEERADRAVRLEGDEIARGAIEARNHAVLTHPFEHVPSRGLIAQGLRELQVLARRARVHLAAVLGEMLIELLARAKADRRSEARSARGR